jgi:hypothetical protein
MIFVPVWTFIFAFLAAMLFAFEAVCIAKGKFKVYKWHAVLNAATLAVLALLFGLQALFK